MFQYQPASLSEVETLPSYVASLSSPIDSYLEDHILASAFRRIFLGPAEAGFYALHDGALLTAFHLVGPARRYGQQIFAEVVSLSGATSAFVPTCDEFFLSHVLDMCGDVKKQAYFFVESGAPITTPAVAAQLAYRLARAADLDEIEAVSGDFLDKPAECIAAGQIHVGYLAGELAAIGIVEPSRLLAGYASIGMFTAEPQRHTGIGASTIIYLRDVCHSQGLIPIAGCWYYNHGSKCTLEAAGMVSPTRLLRIEFGATGG